MNKINPKKIMEIIFIFFIPMLLVIANATFYYSKDELTMEIDGNINVIIGETKSFEYDSKIINGGPIDEIMRIPFELLGVEDTYATNALIDYTALWFIMFITWHLLYLFFDTLMHKVLLRKD